jgi:hypothetical protein
VASRQAGWACAVWLFLFGVFGKIGGIITSIPDWWVGPEQGPKARPPCLPCQPEGTSSAGRQMRVWFAHFPVLRAPTPTPTPTPAASLEA